MHVDETPVALLGPGNGKTHRAYVWVFRTTDFVRQRAVWFDFWAGPGGEHPRRVLGNFRGSLVSDDYSGYSAIHARADVTEVGCMAHARLVALDLVAYEAPLRQVLALPHSQRGVAVAHGAESALPTSTSSPRSALPSAPSAPRGAPAQSVGQLLAALERRRDRT